MATWVDKTSEQQCSKTFDIPPLIMSAIVNLEQVRNTVWGRQRRSSEEEEDPH